MPQEPDSPKQFAFGPSPRGVLLSLLGLFGGLEALGHIEQLRSASSFDRGIPLVFVLLGCGIVLRLSRTSVTLFPRAATVRANGLLGGSKKLDYRTIRDAQIVRMGRQRTAVDFILASGVIVRIGPWWLTVPTYQTLRTRAEFLCHDVRSRLRHTS